MTDCQVDGVGAHAAAQMADNPADPVGIRGLELIRSQVEQLLDSNDPAFADERNQGDLGVECV